MKNILNAVIDEARNLVITPSEGFAGEHNAEVLEIDIGPFATGGYDYFILNFENFSAGGKLISNIIRTENDEPSYIDNGVIYCPLTAQLTASGRLRLQLEAHKNTDSGEIVKKSSVAELSFKPSVMGADDVMNSNGTFSGVIDEVQQNVEALEKKLDSLRVEEYNDRIDAAEEKSQLAYDIAQVMEGRVADLETDSLKAKEKLDTLEGYEIAENFAAIGERVQALEEKPDGIDEIPLATKDSVGGVKLSTSGPVQLTEDGRIDLKYSGLNMHALSAMIVLSLISETASVDTIVGDNCEEIAVFVYDVSMNIASDTARAVAFTSLKRGTIEYITADFNVETLNVEPNHIYVITKKNGSTAIDVYYGTDLRQLILEGI